MTSHPPRLLCDEMLGKLASWLRILGFDTLYVRDLADPEVVQVATAHDRVVLTRDEALSRAVPSPPGIVLVRDRDPHEQVREVLAALHETVDDQRLFTRCTRCNGVLEPADADDVEARVPEGAREAHDSFRVCPDCGQLYWPGTHVEAIRTFVRSLPGGQAIQG